VKFGLRRLPVDMLAAAIGVNSRNRLSTLMYHRVMDEPDYMRSGETILEDFKWQMELISRYFCPLSISDALELMESGSLPERAICVTFDDGYADNAVHALPILKKWRIPATVFVSTNFLDGGIMWNDLILEGFKNPALERIDLSNYGLGKHLLDSKEARYSSACEVLTKIKHLNPVLRDNIVGFISNHLDSIPTDLMLTSGQLLHLRNEGVEIGAHTHTHPILASLENGDAYFEISNSKKILETIIGGTVNYFAYPNGKQGQDFCDEHASMVEEIGFRAAFSTMVGVSDVNTDRYRIPRFTPWDKSRARFLVRLILNMKRLVGN